MSDDLHEAALELLVRLTGRPDAAFHDGQWEAIEALVRDHRRALVVQRTGWGKSAVYFIATRLLRDQGAGPTILLSPLLALMRNQIEAAERMGVRARTINSRQPGRVVRASWPTSTPTRVDLLLISPERLANRRFREAVLDVVGSARRPGRDRRGALHQRLGPRLPARLPPGPPHPRPAAAGRPGAGLHRHRQRPRGRRHRRPARRRARGGPRPARPRQPRPPGHRPARPRPSAWPGWRRSSPTLDGTGIVYCLTKRDAQVVTDWLRANGIDAGCYTGEHPRAARTSSGGCWPTTVKVVVATSALGMGFDKPDLAFVIHFQSPGSPISYYQQVGRAGRQLDASLGVLLRGNEDRDIQDWFISRAFPTREEADRGHRRARGRATTSPSWPSSSGA